jgi:hypothetical protein
MPKANKRRSNTPSALTPELKRALDAFPKLVKEKERNFKRREKDIRRFDDLVKQLKKARIGMKND